MLGSEAMYFHFPPQSLTVAHRHASGYSPLRLPELIIQKNSNLNFFLFAFLREGQRMPDLLLRSQIEIESVESNEIADSVDGRHIFEDIVLQIEGNALSLWEIRVLGCNLAFKQVLQIDVVDFHVSQLEFQFALSVNLCRNRKLAYTILQLKLRIAFVALKILASVASYALAIASIALPVLPLRNHIYKLFFQLTWFRLAAK